MSWLLRTLYALLFLPVLVVAALLPGRRSRLVWGSTPIISYRYWSEAQKQAGRDSLTIMEGVFSINKAADFDRLFADYAPSFLGPRLRNALGALSALLYVLRRAQVLHSSFDGFALGRTGLWRLEAPLLKLAGVRIVVLPYGGDAYVYSRVADTSVRYGLLASYPRAGRREPAIRARVDYWNRHADAVITGSMIDGAARWDVTMSQSMAIDTAAWPTKQSWSASDASATPVRIVHTPNHRGFKGTEFLVDAVDRLRGEGLNIELVLLEKIPNDEVRRHLLDADILAEQFIYPGYALSAIEGMACGLPVLANLDEESHTRVFRRYSFLDECPVLSTPPERLADNLRILARNPQLREQLGRAGRAFVEKYHSYAMAQYMFGAVYERIVEGRDVDLINLFHPLKSDFNRRSPRIGHPLRESRLPPDWEPQRP